MLDGRLMDKKAGVETKSKASIGVLLGVAWLFIGLWVLTSDSNALWGASMIALGVFYTVYAARRARQHS